MPPHEGLVHLKEYDWRDSNVELVNSEIDHKVKYQSAATEPAWNDGVIGTEPGLYIWRIEEFEVVPWPKEKYGSFHEGDSYIVLLSEKVKTKREANDEYEEVKLVHDIFFWLGRYTTQDEAGTAAYKTVELDEFLHGTATQHRELQTAPSPAFSKLFPRLKILRGGVRSGFTHVETNEEPQHVDTLLRIFKHPSAGAGRDGIIVHEVEPTWQSLDEDDVYVLDRGNKIFVWQGKNCAPIEKLKAAQVVNDLTIAKHVDVEVLSQSESRSLADNAAHRSKIIVDYLGGHDVNPLETKFNAPRPIARDENDEHAKKLFRLSDTTGQLSFNLIKEGDKISQNDFDGNDVWILDLNSVIWVWEGKAASVSEKSSWLKVAQRYAAQRETGSPPSIAKVVQGNESRSFWAAVQA